MGVLKSARGLFASSGLPSANTANADSASAQQEEETGVWHYLIVDPSGVRPRETPNYEGKKIGKSARYNEGKVITVERRRKSGWTKWVYIKEVGGWVFDVSPKKDRKVRMVEVECVKGEWAYEATSEMAAVTPEPSPQLITRFACGAAKPANCLKLGEMVNVSERVRPLNGKGSFLKLADGRGYVVDFMDGKQIMRRSTSNPQSDTTPNPSPPLSNSPSVTDMKPAGSAVASAVEYGEWTYVIVDPKGVCPRNSPTYDKASKTDRRVEEGEIVRVSERRAAEGTTFLKISSPAGWIFDNQPSQKSRVRAAEINIERGSFLYRIVAEKGVALRSRCSFADSCKVGRGPEKGALVDVKERIRIGETTFLKLQCGLQHGWVFDKKNKRNLLEELGSKDFKEMELEGNVKESAESGVHLRVSPTMEKWALTKMLLLANSRVQVTKSAKLENKEWLQVNMPGRQMEGWVLAENIIMDQTITTQTSMKQPWKVNPPAEKMNDLQKARQNTLQYRVLGSTSNPQCA